MWNPGQFYTPWGVFVQLKPGPISLFGLFLRLSLAVGRLLLLRPEQMNAGRYEFYQHLIGAYRQGQNVHSVCCSRYSHVLVIGNAASLAITSQSALVYPRKANSTT